MTNQNQTPMPSGIIPYGIKIPWHPTKYLWMPESCHLDSDDEYIDYHHVIMYAIFNAGKGRKISIYNATGCGEPAVNDFSIEFETSARRLAGQIKFSKQTTNLWRALYPGYESRLGVDDEITNLGFKIYESIAEEINEICANHESGRRGKRNVTLIEI